MPPSKRGRRIVVNAEGQEASDLHDTNIEDDDDE